ncbi:hypothetical protein U1Q18_019507, partial [Sarracenia purpurea var. burkii]
GVALGSILFGGLAEGGRVPFVSCVGCLGCGCGCGCGWGLAATTVDVAIPTVIFFRVAYEVCGCLGKSNVWVRCKLGLAVATSRDSISVMLVGRVVALALWVGCVAVLELVCEGGRSDMWVCFFGSGVWI